MNPSKVKTDDASFDDFRTNLLEKLLRTNHFLKDPVSFLYIR